MSYQALYRKYRPASFDEVVGQRHIVQTLKNAIERDRIGHAYLFCGARGTGKTSIAKIFARTLNCTGENKPCMVCENCRESLEGTHPDIIEIDAASNNGVDDVRDLIERVGYAPMLGRYKIYIIDEVHMMTAAAFNALLKTIEEPPEHVIFIFATTEPNKVLPTILSRCQRYDFSQVSEADITYRLKEVCKDENISAEQEALELIAELANGGMRDALSILDQCVAYEPDNLTLSAVREIYGVVQTEEIGKVIEQLTPEHMQEAISFIEDIEAKGFDLKRFVSDMISLLKDSLIYDMAPHTSLLSGRKREVIEQSVSQLPSYKRVKMVGDLMDLFNKLAFSSNVLDYIETTLLKAALYENQKPVSQSYDQPHISQKPAPRKSEMPAKSYPEPQKSIQTTQNSDLAKLFWNSDVSRETFRNGKNLKSEFRFEEDFLLSLLVGANKEFKKSDLEHMNELPNYLSDVKFAKFADSMKGAQIGASGETYILLAVPRELEKDRINLLQENEGFEAFTSKLLDAPKKVFAITAAEMKNLVAAFKKRAADHTLPQKADIKIELKSDQEEISVQEELEKRFPDLIVQDD